MDRMKNELNDFFDNDTNKLAAVQVSDTFLQPLMCQSQLKLSAFLVC